MGHHSGRGTAAAAMVHSVFADDDSYGVFGTSKHTDSYIRNNNRRVKKELQIFAILVAGSKQLRRIYGKPFGHQTRFYQRNGVNGGRIEIVCVKRYYERLPYLSVLMESHTGSQ